MNIHLKPYDIVGGTRDGEWGVDLYVDGEYKGSYMDETQALWVVLQEEFGATVTHEDYVWGGNYLE